MTTLNKRIDALEQKAKLLAAQCKPPTSKLSIDDFHKVINEILTREMPVRTQEEQIQDFKDRLVQMRIDWDRRHGGR